MSDHSDYLAFLRRKIKLASFAGFDIHDDEINPILKPHQRACVKWAVRGGNRALFERFGGIERLRECDGVLKRSRIPNG